MRNELVCDSESKATQPRNMRCKTCWAPGQYGGQAGAEEGSEARKQPLFEDEVTSTVQGALSSSADVPVDSSVATSVSVEDMVQTDVPTSTSGRTQPARAGTVGSLCFNESKAKDFEKLTNLVLT